MKPILSWDKQMSLLISRGLTVEDSAVCLAFLKRTNYYRFSGYARYFQQAPHADINQFQSGVTFGDIQDVYEADSSVRATLRNQLEKAEVLLRTHVAYVIATQYSPYGKYLDESFYADMDGNKTTVECCLQDLERSHEQYILHYKTEGSDQVSFSKLPVWAAVEALSFGTLSKCIERGARGELADRIALSVGVANAGFAYRVRSLVYLRNRCAHHSRLWNHSVVDAGPTPNNVRTKAKRLAGQFWPRSIMDVVASLDDIVVKGGAGTAVLPELVECFHGYKVIWDGYIYPKQPQDHS